MEAVPASRLQEVYGLALGAEVLGIDEGQFVSVLLKKYWVFLLEVSGSVNFQLGTRKFHVEMEHSITMLAADQLMGVYLPQTFYKGRRENDLFRQNHRLRTERTIDCRGGGTNQ